MCPTYFTINQCEKIHRPIYTALLPKLGYNRHLPLALRFGPTKYGGVGLKHMYTEQCIKHLQYFIGTLRQDTEQADTLRILISTYQLQIGTEQLFLNYPQSDFSYYQITSRTSFLWSVSNHLQITYKIEDIWLPKPARVGDRTIMELLVHNNVSTESLQIINACRIFLQVIYVSDIVNADGKSVCKWALHPKPTQPKHSNLVWPYQPFPSERHWRLWRHTLLKVLHVTTNHSNEWNLRYPLGPWHPGKDSNHIQREYAIDPVTHSLWDIKGRRVYNQLWYADYYRLQYDTCPLPTYAFLPADIRHTTKGIHAL